MVSYSTIVVPGDRLGSESEHEAGRGTYTSRGFIYAAILGRKIIQQRNDMKEVKKLPGQQKDNKPCIVVCDHIITPTTDTNKNVDSNELIDLAEKIPMVGNVVWCRVLRVTARSVNVDILMTEPPSQGVYREPFKGQIRKEEIRTYELDALRPAECYRPGDVVLAQVISTGDSRGDFLLSTTPIYCGVVFGTSAAGGELDPISYKMMKCSKTGCYEPRKVARPRGAVDATEDETME